MMMIDVVVNGIAKDKKFRPNWRCQDSNVRGGVGSAEETIGRTFRKGRTSTELRCNYLDFVTNFKKVISTIEPSKARGEGELVVWKQQRQSRHVTTNAIDAAVDISKDDDSFITACETASRIVVVM